MDLLSHVLFLYSILSLSFLGTNGQAQEWNTKHNEVQSQDLGAEQQHWASGKAGNGGTQFMSMASLNEKMQSLWELDNLFINNAVNIISTLGSETAQGAPDVAKEAEIERACAEVNPTLHQQWAMTVIDNVFAGQPDLGLGASYPVILPMLVPVRFLADKDMDITIEQIYSPPPTDQESLNDGGGKVHQNTEKLHIHMGPKDSAVTPIDVKDAIYSGEEGFLFTGKLSLKRSTLCKILCLRGTGNVPACCEPFCSSASKKRDAGETKRMKKSTKTKRLAKSAENRNAHPGCDYQGSDHKNHHYDNGDNVALSECLKCVCVHGVAECILLMGPECAAIPFDPVKRERELRQIEQLLTSGIASRATQENLYKMSKYLTDPMKDKKDTPRSSGDRSGCTVLNEYFEYGETVYESECLHCVCADIEAECTIVSEEACSDLLNDQQKRESEIELMQNLLSSGQPSQKYQQNLHNVMKYITDPTQRGDGEKRQADAVLSRSERDTDDPPKGCVVNNVPYDHGQTIEDPDCCECICDDGVPLCTLEECKSFEGEYNTVKLHLLEVQKILAETEFTDEQMEKLAIIKDKTIKAQAKIVHEETEIVKDLTKLFEEDKAGTLGEGEFEARFVELDKKAEGLFHRKNKITEVFIKEIREVV